MADRCVAKLMPRAPTQKRRRFERALPGEARVERRGLDPPSSGASGRTRKNERRRRVREAVLLGPVDRLAPRVYLHHSGRTGLDMTVGRARHDVHDFSPTRSKAAAKLTAHDGFELDGKPVVAPALLRQSKLVERVAVHLPKAIELGVRDVGEAEPNEVMLDEPKVAALVHLTRHLERVQCEVDLVVHTTEVDHVGVVKSWPVAEGGQHELVIRDVAGNGEHSTMLRPRRHRARQTSNLPRDQ